MTEAGEGRLGVGDPRETVGDPRNRRSGWRSRGYLPHFDAGNIPQMVTFRLADSFPRSLLLQWKDELAHLPDQDATTERRKRIEAYLDKGTGMAWLADARIAVLVQDSLLYFDGSRYRLHAWVIMPNHVHALLTPSHRDDLSSIVHSWKSYTAGAANRLLGREGNFWHREYFDRAIRDDRHFTTAVTYIEANPLRAGLCTAAADWPFSSAGYTP